MNRLVDDEGNEMVRPRREDFEDSVSFIRAVHAYNDSVTRVANLAFDKAWRKEMKR